MTQNDRDNLLAVGKEYGLALQCIGDYLLQRGVGFSREGAAEIIRRLSALDPPILLASEHTSEAAIKKSRKQRTRGNGRSQRQ